MISLIINTATEENFVALFTDGRVLAESAWPAQQNQAETLMAEIKGLFQTTGFEFENLTQIVVVHGPGAFTSLRVGVVTANAMAYSLKIPLYTIGTFEHYSMRLKSSSQNTALFIAAGKQRAYYLSAKSKEEKIYDFEEIMGLIEKENVQQIYGSIKKDQITQMKQHFEETGASVEILSESDLDSIAQALVSQKTNFSKWQSHEQVEPLYIQDSNITWSAKIATT